MATPGGEARGHGPSPLAGVEYLAARGEFDLFRFVPSAVDDVVLDFLGSRRGLGRDERAAVRAALTMDDFYTLLAFAQRSALRTLRERDAALVAAGIDAVSMIDAGRIDWRDAVVATALLAYTGGRTGLDVAPLLAAAAEASEPGTAGILTRFVQERVDRLGRWGYRELSTPSGPVLASDWGRPFAPTADLASATLAVPGLFDQDVWVVSRVVTGSQLAPVWLRADDGGAAERALGSVVACVSVEAALAATASPAAADQRLTVWIVECSEAGAAATIAGAAGPGPRGGFEAIGIAAGPLCAVMISRSVMAGAGPYERAGSLERFRPGLSALLATSREPRGG